MKTGDDATVLHITAGTYSPILTLVANLDAASSVLDVLWRYIRVGDIVWVSGRVDFDVTAGGVVAIAHISLPIPSNFAHFSDANGTGAIIGDTVSVIVDGDPTTDTFEISFTSAGTTKRECSIVASYIVQ